MFVRAPFLCATFRLVGHMPSFKNQVNMHTTVIWVVKFQEKKTNLTRFSEDQYTPGQLLYFVNRQ